MTEVKNIKFPSGSTVQSFLHSENHGFSDCLFFKINKETKK